MTIAIVAAMQPELDHLRSQLTENSTLTYHGFDFHCGTIANQEVVLIQCGIGKVAAAIATTIIVDKFSPSAVINTGSAGGLDANMNIGDVIIGAELRHHDVDVTPFGFEYGQVFDMPAAYHSEKALMDTAALALSKQNQISATLGLIVTGDSFLYQPEKVSWLQQQFPNAKAVEMEGAAIAQTCYSLNVPCVVIRALSDIAGKSSHMSFEQFLPLAGERSANMVIEMLKHL
jgi:adenosylhomocysteine nucleosidase